MQQHIRDEACNDFNEAFLGVYSDVMRGESSDTRVAKDHMLPEGDACRADGTLKDASEIEWVHSPSDLTREQTEEPSVDLKRKLPVDSAESDDERLPKAKVTHQ